MPETSQISRMAQKISDEIFEQFKWTKIGPIDQNWHCQKEEVHGRPTHPSDVVFWYSEPYRDMTTYIQCDLKSYAASSISTSSLREALISLSRQVACAEISEEWQRLYAVPSNTFEVTGLLFIYNHDGGYDRGFQDALKRIKTDDFDLPASRKMVVLGPEEIHWLNNVASDLIRLRGQSKLPAIGDCSYVYPQAIRQPRVREGEPCAATLEMLVGPWIIMSYGFDPGRRSGIILYYRPSGETIEEFLYLIDFLRQNDLISRHFATRIRTLDVSGSSLLNFQKAQQTYLPYFDSGASQTGLAEALGKVQIEVISNRVTSFSEEQIGMQYA